MISPKYEKHIRILFQNVNSLVMFSSILTLESTRNDISHKEIDIACLAETITKWAHHRGKSVLLNTTKCHLKHSHITTSETNIKRKELYKPGGTVILSLQPLCTGITSSRRFKPTVIH